MIGRERLGGGRGVRGGCCWWVSDWSGIGSASVEGAVGGDAARFEGGVQKGAVGGQAADRR